MILQFATALAIGIYVALSKDVERATSREPLRPTTEDLTNRTRYRVIYEHLLQDYSNFWKLNP
jgi:hypothetical protein